VIEPAKIPLTPVRPNRLKIFVVGIVLGLMLGAGAVLLAELLDNSIKNVEDVKEYLDYEILGVIPQIASLKKAVPLQKKS
ncbi:MAG: capsular biosynthesis protein, partial [candidate division Zixibacteria bacterium]|nr:capsular biosynthesis protein [candidate division Zixibacteria bacterium]